MKRFFKLLALVSILFPLLTSCSGGGSSESMLFGKLPSVYAKYMQEQEKMKEEAKNIKTDEEKAEYLKKSEQLKEEWKDKLIAAGKEEDGKTLDISESNIKVTEPITLSYENIKPNGLYPFYKLNGKAEAAENIPVSSSSSTTSVYIVGYDQEGQKFFSTKVGTIAVNTEGEPTVMAGTPVKFNNLSLNESDIEKYDKIKSLKLEIQ